MNIKNTYKAACLGALAIMGLASCEDWLTVYPQTQIVEENFWEDKNDLEGVRYAAYKNMCGTLDKITKWGEIRSDAYVWNGECNNIGDRDLFSEIREAKLDRDSANAYFQWGGLYTTINYCNKVLKHGPEVLEKDRQFMNSEWVQIKAEMVALRALNYFYLLRSFKDIPYSTKVINKDVEVEYFDATNQLVALDSIILDVEDIQGTARNRFTQLTDTKGLITNSAIYAMLSDMYLWRASLHEGRWGLDTDRSTDTVVIRNIAKPSNRVRNLFTEGGVNYTVHTVKGDYQLAAEYADKALAALARQNVEENKQYGTSLQEKLNYGLQNCDMYKNEFDGFNKGQEPRVQACTQIFGNGNSQESIFELQFSQQASSSNPINSQLWGVGQGVRLAVSKEAIDEIYTNDPDGRYRDSRLWFSAWEKTYGNDPYPYFYCFKWCDPTFVADRDSKKTEDIEVQVTNSAATYSNYIIYRMSDMMLIKAEALAAIGETKEAMRYVNAIHRRWYCNDHATESNQPVEDVMGSAGSENKTLATNKEYLGNAPKAKTVEIAVMNERFLEFLGEGKRWYDLVRYAERHAGGIDGTQDEREYSEERPVNNGRAGVDKMVDDFMSATYSNMAETLKNRMKNRYGLYNIIHYMEIKASVDADGVQHLEQNPVWNKSKYD